MFLSLCCITSYYEQGTGFSIKYFSSQVDKEHKTEAAYQLNARRCKGAQKQWTNMFNSCNGDHTHKQLRLWRSYTSDERRPVSPVRDGWGWNTDSHDSDCSQSSLALLVDKKSRQPTPLRREVGRRRGRNVPNGQLWSEWEESAETEVRLISPGSDLSQNWKAKSKNEFPLENCSWMFPLKTLGLREENRIQTARKVERERKLAKNLSQWSRNGYVGFGVATRWSQTTGTSACPLPIPFCQHHHSLNGPIF